MNVLCYLNNMDEEDEKIIKSYKTIEKTDWYTKYFVEFTDGTTTEYPVFLKKGPQYAARLPRWIEQVKKMDFDNRVNEDTNEN